MRILEFNYIHDPLEGQLIEIEPVALVVVSGNGLGVIVYKHSPVALLLDGLKASH